MSESGDPMDALRLPVVAVTPRPAFVAELRAKVVGWLGGDDDPGATTPTATVAPMLSCRGAADAIAWYIDVFAAEALGDAVIEDNGRVGHMELRFGNVAVSVADEYPEYGIVGPTTLGGAGVGLRLEVDDCDAVFARATAAGAEGRRPPEDQFYGARAAEVVDPWGHRWHLHQTLEQLTGADLAQRLVGTEYELRSLDDLGDLGDLDDLDVPEIELGGRNGPESQPAGPAHDQNRPADRVGDLGYFTIDAPDPDAAADFFGALFGWRVEQGSLEEGRHIATIAPPGGIHGGRPPGYTIYFRVDDLEAAAARVRELGGEVLSITEYRSGGNASCRDPQGVPFELWKAAPGY